jgi:predicted TPR repeat methyltransferase
MEPIVVPPGKKEVDLGQINSQLVVGNPATPDTPPTVFSVTLAGEHSETLPGQLVDPGSYWLHGVLSPMVGQLVNGGPSRLEVYIDAVPEALRRRTERDQLTPATG